MRKLLIILPLLFCCFTLVAQQKPATPKPFKLSKYQALQMESVAVGLKLKGEKLTKYKDIYYQYCKRAIILKAKEPKLTTPNITEEQIEKTLLESYKLSKIGISLKEEFYHKFKKIFTPKQILRMYNLEKQFREKFSREQRERTKATGQNKQSKN